MTPEPKSRDEMIEEAAEKWAEETEPTIHDNPPGERVPIRQVWLYRGFLAGAAYSDANPKAASGEDEDDREAAEEFCRNPPAYFTDSINKVYYAHLEGIRSGRKGTVSASKVERLKASWSGYLKIDVENLVAEAVNADRQRIVKVISKHVHGPLDEIMVAILTPEPKPQRKGRETRE